jgi:hypothetical protein
MSLQAGHAEWLRNALPPIRQSPPTTGAITAVSQWAAECWVEDIVKPLKHGQLVQLIPLLNIVDLKPNMRLCERGAWRSHSGAGIRGDWVGQPATGAFILVAGSLTGFKQTLPGQLATVVALEELISPSSDPVWGCTLQSRGHSTLLHIPRYCAACDCQQASLTALIDAARNGFEVFRLVIEESARSRIGLRC